MVYETSMHSICTGVAMRSGVLALVLILAGATASAQHNRVRLRYATPKAPVEYTVEFSAATTAGAAASIKTSGNVAFKLGLQEEQRRSFTLEEMSLDLEAAGTSTTVRGSGARFELKQEGEVQMTLGPKETSPTGLSLNDLFGTPTHTFRFSATGPAGAKPNTKNGLVALGLVDFAPMSMFFFPTLSPKLVRVGDHWTSNRTVPTSVNVTPAIQTKVKYSLRAFTSCGSQQCAVIQMSAKTGIRSAKNKGRDVQVTYEFRGELLHGLTSGQLESADVSMTMTTVVAAMQLPIEGEYRLRRR